MMVGAIHPSGDALLPIKVHGPRGKVLDVDAVVDTGFNDWLTLSAQEITTLGLAFREEARYTLADGSVIASRLFTAQVDWLGEQRRILIVEMDGGPLIGMAMLRGCKLTIDVIDGGRVQIEPLST